MSNSTWTWRPLGELFEIGAGKTMSESARSGADKVPFLRTSNVFWDEIDLAQVDEMSIPADELANKSLRPGDLLVCEGGEIGRAAIWNGERLIMSFQNHLHRLRPLQSDIDPRFYVFFLQSAFTQLGIFEGAGNKTTIPNLSRNGLAALEIPHPPISDQRSISLLLGRVRDAMKVNDKALGNSEEIKKTVMCELFTRGLRGEAQKETAVGLIPMSWQPRSISELCEIKSGGTPRKAIAEHWTGDIPWISGKDLKSPMLSDAIDHISEAGLEAGSQLAPTGSVLLLVRGMGLAKDLPVAVISRPMAFNQDVKALITKGEFSGAYLRSAIYFSKERILNRIVRSAHGTMTLNLDDVETFVVPCPSSSEAGHAEADEIVRVLEIIDRKIELHKQKRTVLEQLFKALLHKLMTGEIRVDQLDLSALRTPALAEGAAA